MTTPKPDARIWLTVLLVYRGPTAMWLAAFAALILGDTFASVLCSIASVGWLRTVGELTAEKVQHTDDLAEAVSIAREMHDAYMELCDDLDNERLAARACAQAAYDHARVEACAEVNTLLEAQGSALRITHTEKPLN